MFYIIINVPYFSTTSNMSVKLSVCTLTCTDLRIIVPVRSLFVKAALETIQTFGSSDSKTLKAIVL